MVEEFETLHNYIAEHDAMSGVLTISIPRSLSRFIEVEIIDFADRHPGLEISVSYSYRFVNLVGEGIDLAVWIGNLPDSSLVIRRLVSAETITCASPRLLADLGTPLHPADLHRYPAIVDPNGGDGDWSFQAKGRSHRIQVKARLRMGDSQGCLAAAARGLGVVRAFDFAATPYLRSGELVQILADYGDAPLPVSVVCPTARHVPMRVRSFITYLVQRAKEESSRWADQLAATHDKLPMIGF